MTKRWIKGQTQKAVFAERAGRKAEAQSIRSEIQRRELIQAHAEKFRIAHTPPRAVRDAYAELSRVAAGTYPIVHATFGSADVETSKAEASAAQNASGCNQQQQQQQQPRSG